MSNKIFVSIAAFRDPELVPTINSLLENAKFPENLKICIAWQHGDLDFEVGQLDDYKNDERFIILDIPYLNSKGACWARSTIQQEYRDEDWHLQLDSHHRFVPNWDEKCLELITYLKNVKQVNKPMLTSYIPSYNPRNDPEERAKDIWRLDWDRFIPETPFFVLPASMTEEEKKEPLVSRFFSGHFVFVQGSWIKEVPYDPNLFFHGEEGSLAVRSWTSGYDMFNPNIQIAFHEYTRDYRKGLKVWDENSAWVEFNNKSHERHRQLFEMDGVIRTIDFGIYDFGKERTVAEYEKFSGIQFKSRGVQQWTLDHNPAPNPNDHWLSEEDYQNSFQKIFRHCLDIWKKSLPEKDYLFFALIFKDENNNDMYREDVNEEQIKRLEEEFKEKDWYNIWRQFHTSIKPTSWILWPYSKSKGWCQQLTGKL